MSLVELILSQKLILLSIGFVAAPLLAALTLSLVKRVKQSAAKRARAAARVAARNAAIAAVQKAELAAVTQAEEAPMAAQADVSAVPASPGQSQPPSPEQPAEETSTQPTAESPEIQNILSSVFADDETSSQYETLLADLPEVDAAQLVTMSAQIAHQIRAGSTPDAQR